METVQTLIVTNDCFNTYAKGFGDIGKLDEVQNEWLANPVFGSIGLPFVVYGLVNINVNHRCAD